MTSINRKTTRWNTKLNGLAVKEFACWKKHGMTSDTIEWYLEPLNDRLEDNDYQLLADLAKKSFLSQATKSDRFSPYGIRRLRSAGLIELTPVNNNDMEVTVSEEGKNVASSIVLEAPMLHSVCS